MRLSNPFKKNFANTKILLHPLKGLKMIVVLMQIHVPETELAAEGEAGELRPAAQPVKAVLIRSGRETRWLRFWLAKISARVVSRIEFGYGTEVAS